MLDARVESRTLEIEVDADQPCRVGEPSRNLIVRERGGKRLAPSKDDTYRADDLRFAITVVCGLRSDHGRGQ